MPGLLKSLLTPSAGMVDAQNYKPSGWRILDGLLAGRPVSDTIDAERAKHAALLEAQNQQAGRKTLVDSLTALMQPSPAASGPVSVPPMLAADPAARAPRPAPLSIESATPAFVRAAAQGVDTTPYERLVKASLDANAPFVAKPNEVVFRNAAALQEGAAPLLTNRDPGENGYTLAAGARRYDSNGKLIAEAPFAPQIVAASPESTIMVVDKNAGGAPSSAPRTGPVDFAAIDGLIGTTGGRITSGLRSQEHNADVGGVANSFHLTGQARDVVPPPGVPMKQYAESLRREMPGMDVLDEGDHVHIEPGQGAGRPASVGGTRVLQQGKPKADVRTLTPDETVSAGFLPGTIVQQKADGTYNTVQSTNNQASPRKAEADLRKEFNNRGEVKEFKAVEGSFNQIRSLVNKPPSAAGDMSMVFSFMKMLDPGSVVREGEFASAQNAAGVPDRVRNAYNKAMSGQILNPKQRKDFVAQAETIYGAQKGRFDSIAQEYRGYASDYGVDPERVVSASKATPSPSPPTKPPVEGAKRGKDGWYVEDPNRKGSFPRIDQGADGKWRIKSANGQILEWR